MRIWHIRNRSLSRRERRVQALARKGWRFSRLVVASFLLFWVAVAWVLTSEERKMRASDNLPSIALESGSDFTYDLTKLDAGQTRFFTYPINSSERAKLLVNRDSAGVVRVAFASCTTCYASRGDHRLREGKLICGRCQDAMRMGDQNERITPDKGCVAVPVPFSAENNKVIVRAQAIMEGLKTFAKLQAYLAQAGNPPSQTNRP